MLFTLNCTSGPLPLARGGLGWGPPDVAKPRHEKQVSPASIQALKPEKVRYVAIASKRDPTLTLPLPRGGDRK
ncbi:hypothetical protein NG799_24710 [Laspinema sp. D1]|uniref:Uncharacterized protein n=1 Tax=Laspinema palackyanum D2a TaxID=2953684 RepID=A0ABT2MXQ4_9CYAN|nr:hypothetical protein [Laspinema sp. D2a]